MCIINIQQNMNKNFLYILMIAACVFVVYANCVTNDFVWDDNWLIVDNPDVSSFSLSSAGNMFTKDLGYFFEKSNFYRPLQSLSYMAERKLWGLDPAGYRTVNILFHAFNCVLIFFILRRFFPDTGAALVSVVFFAVHPVNTSAVSYVAGRADLMALFFLLAATLNLIRYLDGGSVARACLSAAAFVMALISKEISIVWPLAAALVTYAIGSGKAGSRAKPLILGTGALAAVFLLLRLTVLKFAPLSAQAENVPALYRRALAAGPVLLEYLRLLVFPNDLRMDRDFTVPSAIADPRVIFSAAFLAAAVFFLRRPVKRSRELQLGIGWFAVFLLPSLNIIIPLNSPLSEHWLYMTMPGVCIALAWSISSLNSRFPGLRKRLYISAGIALAAYGAVTIGVNGHWKNEETLFSYIAEFGQVNPRANYNLGKIYLENGEIDKAIEQLARAVEVRKDYYEPTVYLAVAYLGKGDQERAMEYFRRAAAINARDPRGYLIYAGALRENGRPKKAAEIYSELLAADPANVDAYNGIGIALAEQKKYDEARKAWQKGLSIDPGSREIKTNLAMMERTLAITRAMANARKLIAQKQLQLAAQEYEKVLKMDPSNLGALNNLGATYGMMGRGEEAIANFQKVLKITPGSAGAYKNIGVMYFRTPGKQKEAVPYFRKYLELSPGAPDREKILELISDLEASQKPGL